MYLALFIPMQLPSNMILVRVGGPLWLGIMITTWGAIAATFAALSSATMFYILRLLLGLAEAGAFPGLWYMLTRFYTTPEVMPLVEITCLRRSANYRCISLWYILPRFCSTNRIWDLATRPKCACIQLLTRAEGLEHRNLPHLL